MAFKIKLEPKIPAITHLNFTFKQMIILLSSLILLISIPITVSMVQKQQEVRIQAKGRKRINNCSKLSYPCKEGLINFPLDEGKHSDKQVEWWYANFNDSIYNLSGAFALVRANPGTGDRGYALLEITNISSGEFYYKVLEGNITTTAGYQDISFSAYANPDVDSIRFYQAGGDFQYKLEVSGPNLNINLTLASQKRPLVEGGDGYVPIFANYPSVESGYYSHTILSTMGVLDLPEGPLVNITNARGWIDHQWFNVPTGFSSFDPSLLKPHHEWFSIQLNNGVQIVVWEILKETADGLRVALRNMDIIDANGNQTHYDDFDLDPRSYWTTPDGRKFANIWRLKKDGLFDITFQTTAANQYVDSWHTYEGSTVVTAGNYQGQNITGRGFAEMTLLYLPEAPCGTGIELCDGVDNDCDYRTDEFCPTPDPASCAQVGKRCSTTSKNSKFICCPGLSCSGKRCVSAQTTPPPPSPPPPSCQTCDPFSPNCPPGTACHSSGVCFVDTCDPFSPNCPPGTACHPSGVCCTL